MEKTVTLPLEFVKEAHKAACNGWKQRIEEHLPELKKPVFKLNKWYRNSESPKALIFITDDGKDYGFNNGGYWTTIYETKNTDEEFWIPATKEEVETALIQEAKKRGFKKGVKCESIDLTTCGDGIDMPLSFDGEVLRDKYLFTVFKNGKWAELISNPIPNKLQELIEEYGKEKIKEYLK